MLYRSFAVSFMTFAVMCSCGCAGCHGRVDGQDQVAVPTQRQAAQAAPPAAAPVAPAGPGLRGTVGSVAFAITPQFGAVLAQVERELNVLVSVEGADVPNAERQPIDLAIVLDKSGSMAGDKLASVKIAAIELLNRLQPADRVTLISYSTEVTLHATRVAMDDAGRERLKQEILPIRSEDTTALGPATQMALEIMERGRGEVGGLSHVVLLSDGLANVGETDPVVLGARSAAAFSAGVSLSTIGVGLDYNEDLMTRLADQGGGHYHFIRENQMIAGVLEDELKGLLATVAREMRLEVAPRDGFRVVDVFGYPMAAEGVVVSVRVGALRSGQTRDIVVRLAGTAAAAGETEIGGFGLSFADVMTERPERWEGVLAVDACADEARVRGSEVVEVTVRVAEVDSAREMDRAAREVEKGDFAAAEQVLDATIAGLEQQAQATPSPELDAQIAEVKGKKEGVAKAKTSEAARKDYVKDTKFSAYKSSKKGKARGQWKKEKGSSSKAKGPRSKSGISDPSGSF